MNISTPELLSYSNVFENMLSSTSQILAEISRSVTDGICTVEEVEGLYDRILKCNEEALEKHKDVVTEIDLRMKRDLRVKHGIRKVQQAMIEFDTLVKKKQEENTQKSSQDISDAARISMETIAQNVKAEKPADLKIIQDTDSD